MKKIKAADKNIILIIFAVLIVHIVIWMFSGNSPLSVNPYNSYLLQAQAWRDGSLDLGRGYSHLELAEYDYRFFVSFPPFPSVVYFPFVMLGIPVYEGLFALAFALGGAVITYLILKGEGVYSSRALMYTLIFCCGSNLLFVCIDAWVWFIAQNMCYTLTAAAIYCALKKRGFLSFLLWSFAVGCRPFQVLYFPLLCMILSSRCGGKAFVKKYWQFFGTASVAVFYMWLNYARFGNIFEFGHNYLPEFIESKNGQFSLSYLKNNLISLIRLPGIGENGALKMQQFDGMNILLASPVFAVSLLMCFKKGNTVQKQTALILAVFEILLICCHKTMGGWQFGNRYTNDILPFALFIIAVTDKKQSDSIPLKLLMLYGIIFNVVGTVVCNLNAM